MFEMLSLVFGGVLRLAPEVIKLFTARTDQAHEFKMTELQLKIDRARADQQIDLVHAQGAVASDSAELTALAAALQAQATPTGNRRIDALSASVRPILTYWWCLVLYTVAKGITVYVGLDENASLTSLAGMLVTEFDRMVIGSIFSFWFVDRSLRRSKL